MSWGPFFNRFNTFLDARCLVDKDPRSMTVVNDLLHLPLNKIATKVLRHPVIKTFIERRWKRIRLIFLVSFFLYLLFVLLFSSFVWQMYQRDGLETTTVKVKLPEKCDPLERVDGTMTKPKVRSARPNQIQNQQQGQTKSYNQQGQSNAEQCISSQSTYFEQE